LDTLQAIDQGLLYRFGSLHHPWLNETLRALTRLGDPEVLWVAALLLVVAFALAGQRRATLCLGAAALLCLGLIEGTKWFVNRPRPDVAWRLIELPSSASFPSGHALGTVAVYGTAALLMARRLPQRRLGVSLVVLTVLTSLMVGASRSYLGVHYPLDVLGGWAAGLGCALLAFWADGHWERSSRRAERGNSIPGSGPV
jgi:undecaprenyl-diphosphatase